jgi:hypothetical protein
VSPSAEVIQCPFCLGHRRVKQNGRIYLHDRGRRGVMTRCPGSGKTLGEAKAAKALEKLGFESGRPDEPQPEDLF